MFLAYYAPAILCFGLSGVTVFAQSSLISLPATYNRAPGGTLVPVAGNTAPSTPASRSYWNSAESSTRPSAVSAPNIGRPWEGVYYQQGISGSPNTLDALESTPGFDSPMDWSDDVLSGGSGGPGFVGGSGGSGGSGAFDAGTAMDMASDGASVADSAAGLMGAAGAGAAGAGGAGMTAAGVGAMVQDIANIILQIMQISQLTQQTGILGEQQKTLDEIKQINADDLATTRGIYGNIGSTADYNASNSALLQKIADGVDSIFDRLPTPTPVPSLGVSPTPAPSPAAEGLAGALSPLSRIGDFISGKADSLYDIFSGANRVAGVVQGFQDDPAGTSVEVIKLLFGEDRSDRLNSMTEEELNNYGFSTVAAALSSELDTEILKASENAKDRYSARMNRINTIQQMLGGAKDQSSVLVLQAQLQKEMAGIQADNLAAQETANAAAAARAVSESAYMKMRTLENQAMLRQNR